MVPDVEEWMSSHIMLIMLKPKRQEKFYTNIHWPFEKEPIPIMYLPQGKVHSIGVYHITNGQASWFNPEVFKVDKRKLMKQADKGKEWNRACGKR